MSQLRILLVEDNPDDELLACEALKNCPMTAVTLARDGQEALELLRTKFRSHDVPDLILMDLELPKVSGFETLKMIRSDERLKLVPVVVFSSSSNESDIRESYGLGANSFVPKPTEFDRFATAVHEIVSYWLKTNRGANARANLTANLAANLEWREK
jgi:two-component system response regulator